MCIGGESVWNKLGDCENFINMKKLFLLIVIVVFVPCSCNRVVVSDYSIRKDINKDIILAFGDNNLYLLQE